MRKITQAILYNRKTVGTDLRWVKILDHTLSERTKESIEKSKIDLCVLASVIKITMNEVKSK